MSASATPRSWRDLSIRLVVALAFADASIVVLALPQIVNQLHTSISHVTWVIMAYNVALIAGVLTLLPTAHRLGSRTALLAGLGLFGLASIGCGTANSLGVLVALRAVQGVGGALLLCASLPLLADSASPGASPTSEWAAAAAIGAAIGPAAGGLLTQLFDWRAIFLAQAPAAALAAVAVLAAHVHRYPTLVDDTDAERGLGPVTANLALLLLSAGLIGALFLIVILMINVWLLAPAAAAGLVSAIPLSTVILERLARGRSSVWLAAGGAVLLALGLAGLALVTHRQLGWATVSLALCGAGLGLSFTALAAAALSGSGSATMRAGRTVAARDGGLVLGLLILTPVFVNSLNDAKARAEPPGLKAVVSSPIPSNLKGQLLIRLNKVINDEPPASLPDIGSAFAPVSAQATGPVRAQLTALRTRLDVIIQRAVTRSWRGPLFLSSGFALLVLPVLALRLALVRRRRPGASELSPQRAP